MKKMFLVLLAFMFMAGGSMAVNDAGLPMNENLESFGSDDKGNLKERLINIYKSYTEKINSAKIIDALYNLAEECSIAVTEFEEAYAEEMLELEESLSDEQIAKYEKELEKAMDGFEKALESKIEQLIDL